jgi:DMSO/TMAO reductase YedYZ molybdopterin-dependent catalytic subunit
MLGGIERGREMGVSTHEMSRRSLLKGGAAGLGGLTVLKVAGPANAFAGHVDEGEVIPWLDQPAPNPVPDAVPQQLVWEKLDSRITPRDQFFIVQHYGRPVIDAARWRLGITGLVARRQTLALADLRARAHREIEFTLECSGNTGLPFFIGGVGNAVWGGTLRRAGLLARGTEVIFWGADSGQVTVRDNGGVLGGGRTGRVETDGAGGLDLTVTEHFARSMSRQEALHPDNLLCWEMNGAPLPPEHGGPVRLIAPGWYGVANVKWLTRIEVRDQRYAGRFMARDYVTIREEQRDGEVVWTFTNVGRARLKSAPAKVVRRRNSYRIVGAAWGAPIAAVEVRIDEGPWIEARLRRGHHGSRTGYAWRFWTYDWRDARPGEHSVTSRAFDAAGNLQPPPDDALLASKVTYWESNGQITRRIRLPAAA